MDMHLVRYGDEGYNVKLLQYALKRAGMDLGSIDGIFGRRTLRALQQFQRDRGLLSDGVAGKLTWAALFPYITGYTLHRLVQGDSYYLLSRRYGTPVPLIAAANPTLEEGNLQVGESVTVPLNLPVVTGEMPFSSLLTGLMAQGLLRRYPFIQSYSIGSSVMGRPLTALQIGEGPKQVGYNAAHHGNEWITTPVLLRFVEEFARAYVLGEDVAGLPAKELFAAATVHVVPLVNPDGVDLVTGAIATGDSYFEQARALSAYYPGIPFPEGWKANIQGVDLNLQYPAGWDIARRIKYAAGFTRPGPRDFVGLSPLSAPESRAMARWTEDRDFALTLAYHTQGETIYWRYEDYEVQNARQIGATFAGLSGYALEDTPYASGHAGYKDWYIQTYLRPGYTIEAGRGENPLPLSDFESIYAANLPILAQGLTLAP